MSDFLGDADFELYRKLIYDASGITFSATNRSILESRLKERLREKKLDSLKDYFSLISRDKEELKTLLDSVTTNLTRFFRNQAHFDAIEKYVVPELIKMKGAGGERRLRFWSAGCSTGEEPYSIAMSALEEMPNGAAGRVFIKATDISMRMLEKARRGAYPAERVAEIPAALRLRYLLKAPGGPAESFQFRNDVRAMIAFERLNLMGRLPEAYCCSVIFCRNIMIYFDKPTQQSLVQRLSDYLEEGGYLLIGHSESLNNISHGLDYVCPATYRKPGREHTGRIGRG